MDDTIPEAYATHTINLLRVAAGMRAKVIDALNDLEADLIARLARATTINRQARLAALLEQTRANIQATYSVITKSQRKDLQEVVRIEALTTARIAGLAVGADIFSVALTENQMAAAADAEVILGNSSKAWWQGQAADLQGRFGSEMRRGIYSGETVEELMRRVRGTAAQGFSDGIMSVSRRQAATLVRSSVISTANHARLETIKSMDDVNKAVQWVATLDTRTSLICQALDGKMWTIPDYTPIGHDKKFPGSTAHWNCRSSPVPVLKSWEELSGKKLPSLNKKRIEQRMKEKLAKRGMNPAQIEQATANTRASMDGQVNDSLTNESWLAKKDDVTIDKLLGPGRAKLWNRGKGKITMSDLTDQNNRPLTIQQLKDLAEKGTPVPETAGQSYFDLDPEGKLLTGTAPPAPPK